MKHSYRKSFVNFLRDKDRFGKQITLRYRNQVSYKSLLGWQTSKYFRVFSVTLFTCSNNVSAMNSTQVLNSIVKNNVGRADM